MMRDDIYAKQYQTYSLNIRPLLRFKEPTTPIKTPQKENQRANKIIKRTNRTLSIHTIKMAKH